MAQSTPSPIKVNKIHYTSVYDLLVAVEFTDEWVPLFAYDNAEEVDHVYSTMCDEKEMANESKGESHGHAKLSRSKLACSQATNVSLCIKQSMQATLKKLNFYHQALK